MTSPADTAVLYFGSVLDGVANIVTLVASLYVPRLALIVTSLLTLFQSAAEITMDGGVKVIKDANAGSLSNEKVNVTSCKGCVSNFSIVIVVGSHVLATATSS